MIKTYNLLIATNASNVQITLLAYAIGSIEKALKNIRGKWSSFDFYQTVWHDWSGESLQERSDSR